MTQVGIKTLLIPVAITLALLFGTGIIAIKKPAYSCFNGKSIHFDKKVEAITLGSFHMYVYPLVHDCEPEDRFDPATTYKCGYQTYCQGTKP